MPASAQYYGPYHREYWRAYPRTYGYDGPRYGGGGFLRPRFDPRTGGTYCVDPRMTVQSGVCKPYRGY